MQHAESTRRLRWLLGITRYSRTIRLGMKSLWLHRLRSFLTVLGIVFGVCSVIAMLAVGEGASFEAQEQIRQLGSQNIIIRSVKPPDKQKGSQERTWMVEYGLTNADVSHIQNTIPAVETIVPGRVIRKLVWNIGNRVDADIVGTIPIYPDVRNQKVARGRYFTELEMKEKAPVCVLGHRMATELFPIDNPLGKEVRIENDYYRVVGIMEPQSTMLETGNGSVSAANTSTLERMYIPLAVARDRFGEILIKQSSGSREVERVELHEATVAVARQEQVMGVYRVIEAILDLKHDKQDYEITVPLKLLQQAERTKQIFNIVLGTIAAISLLVGGIGIMNIMLASVTERTREIGIRRAIGARRRDIVLQFLVETVLLSASGGVIGVVLGIVLPLLIEHFAHMTTIVTFWSPIIAFTISAVVGVVFGLYPAFRAAHMDPVEALRHE